MFWDSSAVVPLLVGESRTPDVEALLRSDDAMIVWWGTSVECLAALAQGRRAGRYEPSRAGQARARLGALRDRWSEIPPSEEVREHAETLVARHPLRAADALQLAAALTWVRGRPRGRRLCTFDTRLADAAHGEGFTIVPSRPG